MQNYKINRNAQIFYLDLTLGVRAARAIMGRLGVRAALAIMGQVGQVGLVGQVRRVGLVGQVRRVGQVGQVGVRAAPAIMGQVGVRAALAIVGRVRWEGQVGLSRPKNGLQLFCQFNLCFLFFKSSIVYKNTFTTSV